MSELEEEEGWELIEHNIFDLFGDKNSLTGSGSEKGDSERADSKRGDSEEGDSEEGDSEEGESEEGESEEDESEEGESEEGESEGGESEEGESEEGESEEGESEKDEIGEYDAYTSDDLHDLDHDLQIDDSRKRPVMPIQYFGHIKIRREDVTLEDVIRQHCLPFLPAKSLARFRVVCRNWDKWIGHPFLAHRQSNCFKSFSGLFYQSKYFLSNYMSLDPYAYGVPSNFLSTKGVEVRSSCNGLLCFQNKYEFGDSDTYYICNPVTKEMVELPRATYYHGCDPTVVLAFEPSELNFSAHYELICAIQCPDFPIEFEIYSSITNSWRLSEAVVCEEQVMQPLGHGVYLNGIVYWETILGLLALDVKADHYGILPLPSNEHPRGVLTEMRGEVCYVQAYIHPEEASFLVDMYEIPSLSLKQRIHLDPEVVGPACVDIRALPCINTDVLIVLVGKRVFAYNAKDGKVVHLAYIAEDLMSVSFFPYVNTLVRLTF